MKQDRSKNGLYLDPENKKVGGVCSGVANWIGRPDLTALLRLAFVISFLFYGSGVGVYLIMWWILGDPPEQPKAIAPAPQEFQEAWEELSRELRND